MKTIAVNGSPRKGWNTSKLLESAMSGASSNGSEIEIIHLYDLEFKGCRSCFACKKRGGRHFGRCAMNDGLTPVLEKIEKADSLLLGAPIYIGAVSGEMRSFLERLIFQYLLYTNPATSAFTGKLNVGFIYTMNISEEQFIVNQLKQHLDKNENTLKLIFGNINTLYSFDTFQMDNYDGIDYEYLDAGKKAERRKTEFPKDIEKAFELGKRLVSF